MLLNTLKVPAVIRGQVLAQGIGYFVRGQYVIGFDGDRAKRGERGVWFWYDIYKVSDARYGLESAQEALESLAAFLVKGTK